MTAIDSVKSIATGKDLKGTGVWSFVKVEGTPQGRAALAASILAIVVVASNPQLVSAFMTDASINN